MTPDTPAAPGRGRREKWKIRIHGYGTFDFEGTEEEAEEMRRHKANWERGVGMKWRTTNQTTLDVIAEEVAALWDADEGVPPNLMKQFQQAKQDALKARTP